MTLAEIAGAAYIPENLPEGMEPGLEETTFYDPENFVFPFGAHACIVDVDAETGKVDIVRYVAVDDCGPAINPMLIDGQIHGGITHAIGQALYEQIHYDDERPARDRHVRRLRAAERRRGPELRDRPHGDPVAGQLARRQGRRRGGHDRRHARDRQRGDRRAAPARRRLHRHAAHPEAGVGGDPGGQGPRRAADPGKQGGSWDEHGSGSAGSGPTSPRRRWAVIPAEFDYAAPESLDEALSALAQRRRGRQAARRRPLAAAADEAAAGGADAARRPPARAGPARHPRANGG